MLAKSKITKIIFISVVIFSTTFPLFAQQKFDPDTVQAKRFDTGKMWTFDYPPVDYWEETFDFTATEEWLNNVQLSTLRIPGCTASFVSEDGLIVTNHHCSTWHRDAVQEEGEDLYRDGFYAETMEDERSVPNMYADQLKLIRDVTEQVTEVMNAVEGDEEKIKARDSKIDEIEKTYNEETGLKCEVVSYYGGAKFALHGYKRYTNIKLVFVGEEWVGLYGGDYDNFTYPRYNMDYAFFRVYDDEGNPLKTNNYYKWDTSGVELNELLFIVGSPGTTNRLKTAEQLKYFRDISYRNASFLMSYYYNELEKIITAYPERHDELAGIMSYIGNSEKVFRYIMKGLNDPYLIARKEAFDKKLKSEVDNNPELNKKYGYVWDAIKSNRTEARKYGEKVTAFALTGPTMPKYFTIANELITLAGQLKLSEEERQPKYKADQLEETINSIYPADFDQPVEKAKLKVRLDYITLNLGKDNPLVKIITGGKSGNEAVGYVESISKITNAESIKDLVEEGPDAILESDDPFIEYVMAANKEMEVIKPLYDEINETADVLEQVLGEAMFAVYGASIPPDANRSMRIGDGKVRQVEYNGTIAPYHTKFFGLYDRYYSFDKQFPWDLPERWVNYPKSFDLTTTMNFLTDIDVIGGQSGSPIVNRDGNFVGVAFDGNVESIIGSFIFMPEDNRSIVVAAEAIIQVLREIYKADRLVKEIENNKIVE